MCGIAGIFSLSGRPIDNADKRIRKMTSMLIHRGPDSQGTYISADKSLALGNTRLAIVDPLCSIKQPMESLDRRDVISFNGEIYDYPDIKKELESRGVNFRSHMDTEILLEGLRLYGEQLLERIDGMWVFAYYEADKKRLLLSRDIMGERHLFYRIDEAKDEFIFASEMKPILADAGRPFDVNMESLASSLRFYSAPPGKTLVKGIDRLLPGHNMLLERGAGYKIYRYKRLHPEKWFDFFACKPSLEKTVETYEGLFNKTCRRRIPAEVPFICTLSGGLDSSVVCLFASDFGRSRIHTLFGQSAAKPARNLENELDEYAASKFTSGKLNTDHLHIFMNNDECIPVLKRLTTNGFDGMIDPGVASFEMLAWEVKKQSLKVMLISDGPDEFLGGYPMDKRAYNIDVMRSKNPLLYRFIKLMSASSMGRFTLRSIGRGELAISPSTSYEPFRFDPIHQSHGPSMLFKIIDSNIVKATSHYYGIVENDYTAILPKMDYTQIRALSYASVSLPNHFNMRTDKAFMHASIECRLPHQAPEMVEFMIAMPAYFRFNEGKATKYFLREIVERHIGKEISNRSKHGFSTPLWHTPDVYKAMNFEEEIRASSIFADLPFKKGARELVLKPENRKMLWPILVLAKTYDRLKRGVYD